MINIGIVVVFLILFFLFRNSIFNGFSKSTNYIFRPILTVGSNLSDNFSNMKYLLSSKKTLLEENEILKNKVSEMGASISNYESILEENIKLKDILNRKSEGAEFVLAGILSKPNRSPYDTLIIDAGFTQGVAVDDVVFALGNIPIGKVREVFENSSKVVLFSTSGEKTEGVVEGKDVFLQLIGRGGGNFEIVIPRDFALEKGINILIPGVKTYILATVEGIISDPRDSYKKALLRSPVNIQELKFVQIVK